MRVSRFTSIIVVCQIGTMHSFTSSPSASLFERLLLRLPEEQSIPEP